MGQTFNVCLDIGGDTDRYRTFQWSGDEADLKQAVRMWTEHGCFVPVTPFGEGAFIPARWISAVTWTRNS